MDTNRILRELPSVDELLTRLGPQIAIYPRSLVVDEIRRALTSARQNLRTSGLEQAVLDGLAELAKPSLRRVINATGVVLHTNLGRAPLPPFQPISGYSNLEYDLATGKRGKRDVHLTALLQRLLGCSAIVVNNNASAVYLALHELAAGQEVVVSRGELIEIGDGFRIPDIMERSGAILREVGTTNKTNLNDYRNAINERTRLILRVHPSNFHVEGFTHKPALADLAALSRENSIPLYEDLGSGCIADLKPFGLQEPLVSESLHAGVDLVSFSTDKLLGGPQSGILAGSGELISRLRRNPMYRAFRPDKLICQALETSLRSLLFERWNEIPSLQMLSLTSADIRLRAEQLQRRITRSQTEVIDGESVTGGGATPTQSLPTVLIAINTEDASALEQKLRAADPPVIARIGNKQVLIDL
ncbi:MAG: L-seryl-tRNA(Sec) selenium transferase, partial [Bryobacteraceae bacterium]